MRSAEGNGAGGGRELSRGSSPPFQKKKAERERERERERGREGGEISSFLRKPSTLMEHHEVRHGWA